MTAVVTGAGGFLGTYLVRELRARGEPVTGVIRPGRRPPAEWAELGVAPLAVDLRRPTAELENALACSDSVYHLASSTEGTWRSMFDATVLGTERLLALLRADAWKGRLIHVSSFSVYGLYGLPRGYVVDETAPLEPEPARRDDYAWTKWLQERRVRELARDGYDVVVVRPGVIYGRERRFQHQLGREVGDSLLLFGGSVTMCLNYVENTASLLATCGEHPRAGGEVFNAVDPKPLRQWQYLRAWRRSGVGPRHVIPVPVCLLRALGGVLAAAASRTDGRIAPHRVVDPYQLLQSFQDFRYDGGRATRVLGWQPPVGPEEALRRTFSTSAA